MRLGMGRKKIRIGDILVAAGAITEEQLQAENSEMFLLILV